MDENDRLRGKARFSYPTDFGKSPGFRTDSAGIRGGLVSSLQGRIN